MGEAVIVVDENKNYEWLGPVVIMSPLNTYHKMREIKDRTASQLESVAYSLDRRCATRCR